MLGENNTFGIDHHQREQAGYRRLNACPDVFTHRYPWGIASMLPPERQMR